MHLYEVRDKEREALVKYISRPASGACVIRAHKRCCDIVQGYSSTSGELSADLIENAHGSTILLPSQDFDFCVKYLLNIYFTRVAPPGAKVPSV